MNKRVLNYFFILITPEIKKPRSLDFSRFLGFLLSARRDSNKSHSINAEKKGGSSTSVLYAHNSAHIFYVRI